MGIEARWTDETGKCLDEVLDEKDQLAILASGWQGLDATHCLRFIDLYGDTVFNQLQLPVLLHELQNASEHCATPAIESHLDRVIALVASAIDEMHTYIRFVGD